MITKASLERRLGKKLRYLGEGWDRKAYRCGRLVFKIPKDERGMECNTYEAMNWSLTDGECVVTRLINIDGVPVAVQPFLRPEKDSKKIPSWTFGYDGAQGGYNWQGKFQIYDFPPHWMSNSATYNDYY